mmetsp:Transcript_23274/g.65350  ORF Transcript_23274/g.65350 Transcript_23274/m.65350 type:complete len:249 (+) Transcript_23274:138-884(+)|eukprot:CAMPEP_0119132570 /NCGR_PEP_ID=MMETSP1310-20130426/11906_1 /TAXON_ID=464262 /ORGANISM="Genus nov. species nov., Strain RCC2339" /LENGTH=248 /DNA_ID=CAMNT_0007123207 /DNA_START=138 /DNA_END=884 /DNA_ORIENTATION=+
MVDNLVALADDLDRLPVSNDVGPVYGEDDDGPLSIGFNDYDGSLDNYSSHGLRDDDYARMHNMGGGGRHGVLEGQSTGMSRQYRKIARPDSSKPTIRMGPRINNIGGQTELANGMEICHTTESGVKHCAATGLQTGSNKLYMSMSTTTEPLLPMMSTVPDAFGTTVVTQSSHHKPHVYSYDEKVTVNPDLSITSERNVAVGAGGAALVPVAIGVGAAAGAGASAAMGGAVGGTVLGIGTLGGVSALGW